MILISVSFYEWDYNIQLVTFLTIGGFNPFSNTRSELRLRHFLCMQFYFNPRSDERSDGGIARLHDGSVISIHAPTNGATSRSGLSQLNSGFQSTLRRTERHHLLCSRRVLHTFQSTLRRTERPQSRNLLE